MFLGLPMILCEYAMVPVGNARTGVIVAVEKFFAAPQPTFRINVSGRINQHGGTNNIEEAYAYKPTPESAMSFLC